MNIRALSAAVVMAGVLLSTGCEFLTSSESYYYSEAPAATTKSAEESRAEVIEEATYVTYQELARSTDGMEGESIIVTGQIAQVLEDTSVYAGLINITYVEDDFFAYYDDSIYYSIDKDLLSTRILEEDIVTFYGKSLGLITYDSVSGAPITVPGIDVYKVE